MKICKGGKCDFEFTHCCIGCTKKECSDRCLDTFNCSCEIEDDAVCGIVECDTHKECCKDCAEWASCISACKLKSCERRVCNPFTAIVSSMKGKTISDVVMLVGDTDGILLEFTDGDAITLNVDEGELVAAIYNG